MPFIYSTLSNDNAYTLYKPPVGEGGLPIPTGSVLVKGGAGVANDRVITPRGIVTEVTDEEFDLLKQCVVFQRHVKNGYIKVDASKTDPEDVAADMTGRDVSAPLVPQDFSEDRGQKAPTHSGQAKAKPTQGNRR